MSTKKLPDILGMKWYRAKEMLEEYDSSKYVLVCTGEPKKGKLVPDKDFRVVRVDDSFSPYRIVLCKAKDITI